MNPENYKFYECESCGEKYYVHDLGSAYAAEDMATGCCAPDVYEGWQCYICSEEFYDMSQFKVHLQECIHNQKTEEELEVERMNAAETKGQQRLF